VPDPGDALHTVTSFRAKVSLSQTLPALRRAYPGWIANRIDPRLGYDVVFIEEARGALALESDSGLLGAVLSAVERAGLTGRATLREVPGAHLPRRVKHIVGVNPTGGEIAKLRNLAWAA
jgi:glucose-6-phosphate dehydrogenase assembly protein OpcA